MSKWCVALRKSLTKLSKVRGKEHYCFALDKSFGDTQGDSEAITAAGAPAKFINDSEAASVDIS